MVALRENQQASRVYTAPQRRNLGVRLMRISPFVSPMLALVMVSLLAVGCRPPMVRDPGTSGGATPTGTAIDPADVQRVYLDSTPVYIWEIHFDPSSEQQKVEFVEIVNTSREPVDLSGWQVTGAGRVTIPDGTTIAPGQTIVLSSEARAYRAVFPQAPDPVVLLRGKLSNEGETVRIEDPQGRVADEATYDPLVSDEVSKAVDSGLSIHRIRPKAQAGQDIWRAGPPDPGVARRP